MHRLIYCSKQAFFNERDVATEIDRIISVSHVNNARVSVSGLLLFHSSYFVQALEGPRTSVMATYRRILDDRRHREGRVLGDGPADAREFGAWSMCARRLTASDDAILDTLSQRGAFDPTKLSAGSALRLLTTVRDIQVRVAASA